MTNPFLLNEYVVRTSFEFWTAMCYPSLYLARCL